MSREQDIKIAEWFGYKPHIFMRDTWLITMPNEFSENLPNYTEYDANAIALLPLLVERGYDCALCNVGEGWSLEYGIHDTFQTTTDSHPHKTISEAITAAVLQLIEHEVKP